MSLEFGKNINEMSFDELSDTLEKLMKANDFISINEIYKNADEISRTDINQYLFDNTELMYTEDFFLDKINDKYRLVRCDIYDFLSGSDKKETFKALLKRLSKEKSYIAMTYLLMAIGCICRRNTGFKKLADTERIKTYLSKETHETAIPAYLVCLYVLTGNKEYINEYLRYINFEADYHVRCSAVNQVYELADKNNFRRIYMAYKKRYEKEETIAVKSTLETAIKYLEEEFEIT